VRELDHFVVGQQEAKRTLAVAVWTHLRKTAHPWPEALRIDKSNVLIVGPTGSGKTLLAETLSHVLNVPFVTADATSLAQSEYIGEEIGALLQRLVDKAEGDLHRAGRGIVFIDEVDKFKTVSERSRSAAGERVQHALLKIMEGAPVRLPHGLTLDTTGVLFICGGAFVGLEQILGRTHSYGFIAASEGDSQAILDRLNARIKPTDLNEYGLIPEFSGRLPIIARCRELTRDQLVRIMIEPRNALYRQFRELLAAEGVELGIAPAVFEQIAELAIEYRAGARSLRAIFEEMLEPAIFELAERPRLRKIVFRSLFEAPALLEEIG